MRAAERPQRESKRSEKPITDRQHQHAGKERRRDRQRDELAEEKDDGILIRPAVIVPVERYTPERKAEFLLSNAVDENDYRKARGTVRKLGFDPDKVRHRRPR